MSRLYLRLFGWFMLASLLTLGISLFLAGRIAQRVWHTDSDWPAMAKGAVAHYASGGRRGLWEWAEPLRHSGIVIDLLDEHGESVMRRRGRAVWAEPLPDALGDTEVTVHPRPELTLASVPVPGPHNEAWHFIAFRSPPPHNPEQIFEHLATQIAVALLVVAVIGWWVTRTIALPVAALQQTARRLAGGDLSARVGERAAREPGELGQLARDFDYMASRIETLVQRNRSLLQDVSHELRSPLARLQVALGLARRGAAEGSATHFDRAEREVSRLDHLIGEVLALTRMEGDLPGMQTQRLDLAQLLRTTVDDARAGSDAALPQVELHAAAPLYVQGDAELLERAAGNLLSNAFKYGGAGGVEILLERSGAQAVLSVADHGPGVPAEELPKLFQPFFRGSNAAHAGGQGLGLSIVERIARAHGGTLEAENRPEGGFVVRLKIPAVA